MKNKALMLMLISGVIITGCSINKAEYENVEVNKEDATGTTEIVVSENDSVQEEQNAGVVNDIIEEKYIEAVKNLYENNIDLFGNQVENFHDNPEWNKFAIVDIDNDGTLELLLSWTDSTVAGEWGGVYQYDFDKQEFYSEQLLEPSITFYDNGIAYEPWRHNQGPGEMWPFDASLYNASTDQYEHVLSADSWNKDMREEGFPDDVDIDGVGIVYYTDVNAEYVDYDNPISQSEFNSIYNQYFEGANELNVYYYELTEKGLNDYLSHKEIQN